MLEQAWENYLRLIGLIVCIVLAVPFIGIACWLMRDATQSEGPRGCGAEGAGPPDAPAARPLGLGE